MFHNQYNNKRKSQQYDTFSTITRPAQQLGIREFCPAAEVSRTYVVNSQFLNTEVLVTAFTFIEAVLVLSLFRELTEFVILGEETLGGNAAVAYNAENHGFNVSFISLNHFYSFTFLWFTQMGKHQKETCSQANHPCRYKTQRTWTIFLVHVLGCLA